MQSTDTHIHRAGRGYKAGCAGCRELSREAYARRQRGEYLPRQARPREETIVNDVRSHFSDRDSSDCWVWPGTIAKDGYGVYHHQARYLAAHRAVFERLHGPIPAGKSIDHKCRNRACVNPNHLHAVTPKQNSENAGIRKDNKSGYRGVHWNNQYQRWVARVKHYGHTYSAGYHKNVEDAARAVLELRNRLYTNNLSDREA